jgi:lipooligosaccharide transport system permease protein
MRETLSLSWHIVRRNWWVYRKDFVANISPTIADPAFLTLSLGLGLGAFVTSISGHSYLQYLAPGLAVSTAMFTAFFETSYGFYVRMTFENIFKAMLTTAIGIDEIVIGEFIWVSLKGALMVFAVCLVLALFGLFTQPLFLILCPVIGILTALPLGAIGLVACCQVKNINQFQTVYSFVISPLYFFSGIFFPVAKMPGPLQVVAKCLPLYHSVLLSQALFWNKNVWAVWSIHAPILVAYSAVLLIWAFSNVRRRLRM